MKGNETRQPRFAYLDGKIEFRNVFQNPIDNLLDIVFSKELGNRLNFLEFTILIRDQPILTKVVRKDTGNAFSKLLFLLW